MEDHCDIYSVLEVKPLVDEPKPAGCRVYSHTRKEEVKQSQLNCGGPESRRVRRKLLEGYQLTLLQAIKSTFYPRYSRRVAGSLGVKYFSTS